MKLLKLIKIYIFYQTRKKILKCGGIEEYKKYMLDNYKSLNSEYTPMDKKYKDSNYVDKMIVLDVLNILSNNKSLTFKSRFFNFFIFFKIPINFRLGRSDTYKYNLTVF